RHGLKYNEARVLKRLGKIAVVVVGLAGAAGVLSNQHGGDAQHHDQQWIAHPGAPEPDHPQHDEWGGPTPPELPRGVRIATRPELNVVAADGRKLPTTPDDGRTATARAIAVVGMVLTVWWMLRRPSGVMA